MSVLSPALRIFGSFRIQGAVSRIAPSNFARLRFKLATVPLKLDQVSGDLSNTGGMALDLFIGYGDVLLKWHFNRENFETLPVLARCPLFEFQIRFIP